MPLSRELSVKPPYKSNKMPKRAPPSEVDVLPKKGKSAASSEDSAVKHVCSVLAGVEALDSSAFDFSIISKGRPDNVPIMQALFKGTGVVPRWIVGDGEVHAWFGHNNLAMHALTSLFGVQAGTYAKAGASIVTEGGKLVPSRNLGLDLAARSNKLAVGCVD